MREMRTLEMSIQGWSQHHIATDLGISQAAVSKILKRVEERALRELSGVVQRQKARQALRLEHIYSESMRAWERSKAESTRRRQRKTQPGQGGSGSTVAEITVEAQHGDPRFLDEARRALADLNKLWGLDAPQRVDLRASRNPFADLTEDQLRDLSAQQRSLIDASRSLASTTVELPRGAHHVAPE
jgi:predicted transcriptional regulator